MAYRTVVHESIGKNPASVVFGSDLSLSMDIQFGQPEELQTSIVISQVRENLQFKNDQLKTRYDVEANSSRF